MGEIGFVIALCIGLLGLLGYCSYQDDKDFEAKMSQEMAVCLGKGESEYTCKAYVASQEAKRSANAAETMSAVSMGYSAGWR